MPVLVDVAQALQDDERMHLGRPLAMVRLQALDACPHFFREQSKASAHAFFEISARLADGKLDVFGRLFRDTPAGLHRERVGEVVQGTSQVVKGVTQEEAESDRNGKNDPEPHEVVARLQLNLIDEGVWLTVKESLDGVLEFLEIIGLTNLYAK